MKNASRLLLATLMFISVTSQAINEISTKKISLFKNVKPGKCSTKLMPKSMCPDDVFDQCQSDADCHGSGKCCYTGCAKVCVAPKHSGCELTRENSLRRGRAIGMTEQEIDLLECDNEGSFAPIQCQGDRCFCVNQDSGFELPGTRARSLDLVNCSEPLPCAGYVCRMLCPFGFELDDEGCPLCQCRDPCTGVKCPGSGSCVMEQLPCDGESCPPLPTCKQARSLQSLCPIGEPLTIGSIIKKPYLCGLQAYKPPCPPLYKCMINAGQEYGICCNAFDETSKPGLCPAEENPVGKEEIDVLRCGAECDQDFQCPSTQKCCLSHICGQHCIQPTNLTACLHQRMIAELLITSEKKGKGYIPQCDPDTGLFIPKQCSRNGLVCWCSDPKGRKNAKSMASADQVQCGHQLDTDSHLCKEESDCSIHCEYGFVVDASGCNTCRCEDPCNELGCPSGTYCIMTNDPKCQEEMDCSAIPICISNISSRVYDGSEAQDECSAIMEASSVFTCEESFRCSSDDTCSQGEKCCFIEDCHDFTCISGNLSAKTEEYVEGPTMCEYLRDLVQKEDIIIALPTPTCDRNGAFDPIQCNSLGQCWCVDGYGTTIPNTKVSGRDLTLCHKLDSSISCKEFVCDLGCDYGYVLDSDTGCPECKCRDPCKNIDCGALHQCEMVNVPCMEGICPSIPQCIQKQEETVTCGTGQPYIISGSNVTATCNTRSRSLGCPVGYNCYSSGNELQGICCSSLEKSKGGQCPYYSLSTTEKCDLECSEDSHCKQKEKCCSNGCGTICTQPITMTACQHQHALLEHRAREAEIPASKVFLPRCNKDGTFAKYQCHPDTLTCWCVDTEGLEIPGTRVSSPAQPNCKAPLKCAAMNCNLACVHGYQMDGSGCPVCSCRDPCDEITCTSSNEECRIVHVSCVKDPCPPIPVCLPKIENPCDVGSPLMVNGSMVECGPKGLSCPSSHKCHLSPLGEYAKCCPKQRDVCFKWKDSGDCEGSIKRWFFNVNTNTCERFRYTACGGNLNNFESKDQCSSTCPELTSCQLARYKSLQSYNKKNKQIKLLPKCDKKTGAWSATQCLEELGICWCVRPSGEQIQGSLSRGSPNCKRESFRTGRLIELPFTAVESVTTICEPGQFVHICSKTLCENKVCLSHPESECKVNPCGGCSIYFVDASNNHVDCMSDLTNCQIKLQSILNSVGFSSMNKFGIQNVPRYSKEPAPILNSEESELNKDDYDREYNVVDGNFMHLENDDAYQQVGIILDASQCHSDGSWVKEQRSGDFTWCVNEEGMPIHETLTIGHVRCGPNGQILERMTTNANSAVCRDGVQPFVCSDHCMNVTCDSHPDAVCAADPCNQCKISFYNRATGERVRCEQKCSQKVNVGRCGESLKRYFFNATTKQCQSFTYGGCQGNDNRFYSKQQCQSECQVEVSACEQPVAEGHCSNKITRWFYNKASRKCEPFLYSGCGGNDNNFDEKEKCEQTCPDKVACPQWSDFSKDPAICSRKEACLSAPCYGYPDTYCKVDPCSCTGEILNSDGLPTSCVLSSKPSKTRLRFTYEEDQTIPESIPNGRATDPRSVKIFIEGEPTFSRCQLLRDHLAQTKSRNYVAQCDANGEFLPVQCYNTPIIKKAKRDESHGSERISKDKKWNSKNMNYINIRENTFEENDSANTVDCWCVDEIGRKIQPSTYFSEGSYTCAFTPVESVFVTLGFRFGDMTNKIKMDKLQELAKHQVSMLLKRMEARILEEEINIINLPDLTQIKFTLLGKNKIDVAYQLEDQIREGQLFLNLGDGSVIADTKASWFHHRVANPRNEMMKKEQMLETRLSEPREMVSRYISAEHPYMAATVIFSVMTSLLVCGLVMSTVLYRRHAKTRNEKISHGSMQSLTLSSDSFYQSQWSSQSRKKKISGMSPRSSVATIEKEYNSYLD